MHNSLIDVTKIFLDLMKVKVTKNSIKKFIYQHPESESLVVISDGLKYWNVDNYVIQLKKEEVSRFNEFPTPFIGYFNTNDGEFGIIEGITESSVIYYSALDKKRKQISKTNFLEIWHGIALLAFPTNNSGELNYQKNYRKEKIWKTILSAILISALFLLVYSIFQYGNLIGFGATLSIISLKLSGLFISSAIFFDNNKLNESLLNNLCGNKNQCKDILQSKDAKLFGVVSWADLGILYFLGSLLFLLMSNQSNSLFYLAILNLLPLIFSFYSIWFQYSHVNKWCRLCLFTLIVFWLEFSFFYSQGFYSVFLFNITLFIQFIGVFLLTSILVMSWNFGLNYFSKQKILSSKLKQIKYSKNVFETILNNQQKYKLSNGLGLPINKWLNRQNQLTIITNPSCQPCQEIHEKLKLLLNQENNNLGVNIIFLVGNDSSEEKFRVSEKLVSIYFEKGWEEMENATTDWFETNNLNKWLLKYKSITNSLEAVKILAQHQDWCLKNDILVTPTVLLNSIKFPQEYDIMDLNFLLNACILNDQQENAF